jgi:probable rRNA maturation factor
VRPAEVKERAERMLTALGLEDRELSVLLCDDATIRALNRQWRKKDRPTDVLAFPLDERGAISALGDVVISLDTARRQAKQARRAIVEEVTMLLAHGLLHLLGMDHRTVTEERLMTARTDLLCSAARARSRG